MIACCGYADRQGCRSCSRCPYRECPIIAPQQPVRQNVFDKEKLDRLWQAEQLSRLLAVDDLPAPFVPAPRSPTPDPLRHHKLRCTTRRPRMSLHEMVKRAMSKRAS